MKVQPVGGEKMIVDDDVIAWRQLRRSRSSRLHPPPPSISIAVERDRGKGGRVSKTLIESESPPSTTTQYRADFINHRCAGKWHVKCVEIKVKREKMEVGRDTTIGIYRSIVDYVHPQLLYL